MKLAVVENSVKFTEPQWLGSYELEELWASFACEQRKKHSTTGGLISYSPKILSEQCLRDSLSALIRVRFNNAKLYFDKVTEQLLAIVLSEHPVSCLASTNEKVFMKLED
jgi:hypothetical protein